MARGRRAQSDAVKALKGNPGKRKLALENAGKVDDAPTPAAIAVPAFLVHEREKEIFRRVVEDYLQRRIARPVDLTSYGRWASYVHRWWTCKEQLGDGSTWFKSTSKHGDLLRRHPLFKDMLDLERVMQSLEDRLGLNPVARQNIVRGLSHLPPALGGLFGEDPAVPDDGATASEMPEGQPAEGPDGPLGYLQHSGKPH